MIETNTSQQVMTAYLGEVYGISFFQYFEQYYSDKSAQYLWQSLIDVESRTADKLEIFLSKKQIPFNREDKQQMLKGESDAKRWLTLEKEELLATLSAWVKPYEIRYRQWLSDAQAQQLDQDELTAFKLIAAHETAIYLCLNNETSGQSGLHYLTQFLDNNQ
ncbi:hypothetical protein [Shewanella sp. UCD-KL12]|uniref:hypothetical protein n=1 Tax=Shewanella sp. UCD-KL12 TaxID=1917163 RepID=UPI0009703751|nr:hypothetical protein [Shewanella sp. UCD-KL12]